MHPVKIGYVLFLVGVVGGVESRPIDGGSLQKGPFVATKLAQNYGVILVGLGLKCIYV